MRYVQLWIALGNRIGKRYLSESPSALNSVFGGYNTFVFSMLLTACAFSAGGWLSAATINAASTSRSAVGAAYAAANWGDTVVIPPGVSTWSTGLTIDKNITLQGAGIGQTVIRDGISSGYILNCTLVPDKVTRITGIEFRDDGATRDWRFRFSGTSIDGRRIRIDHCKFDSLAGPVFLFYTCLGVVDHNIIIGRSSGVPAFMGHVINSSWGYPADRHTWGDRAYVEGDQFGTDKFLFFEDNNITNLYSPSALTMLDGHSGTRFVFRYNTVYKGSLETHGAEASRTRSGRAFEIYGNILSSDNSRSSPLYMRGGVGLVFSNLISGWTASATYSLLDNRRTDHLFAPINGADGRNPWDKNNPNNPIDVATATSAGTLTVTDNTKTWVNNQWKGFTIRRTSGKGVTSLVRSGVNVTVTCEGHGYAPGNLVSIWGADQIQFNSLFRVTPIDANRFSFQINFPPSATVATGTIKCALGNNFSIITGNTDSRITFADSLYGTFARLVFAAGDSFEINEVEQSMDQIGVIGGTDLKGEDNPTVWTNLQTVSAWYEWDNARDGGGDVDFSTGFGGGGLFPNIIENVHYHNDTVKPGYVPYTYPHPLVSGVESTIPTQPTGLHRVEVP